MPKGRHFAPPAGAEWVQGFVDELADERGYAVRTANRVRGVIVKWLDFAGPSYAAFCAATREDAVAFVEHMREVGSDSCARYDAGFLRSVYKKVVADHDATFNPFDGVDLPKPVRKSALDDPVTPAELRKVLDTARKAARSEGARCNYAVACLNIRCGVSCGEMSRATVGDYARNGGAGLIRLTLAKGGQYVAHVDSATADALDRYLDARRSAHDADPLFTKTSKSARCNEAQTEEGIGRRLWATFNKAGVKIRGRSVKRGMYELARESGATDAELAFIARSLSPQLVAKLAVEDHRSGLEDAWKLLSDGLDSRRPIATATLTRAQLGAALSARSRSFSLVVDAAGDARIVPDAEERKVDQKRAEIAARRAELGLTQQEAADAVGVDAHHWSRIERGTRDVSPELAPSIEDLLGMSLVYGVEEVDLSGCDEPTYLRCMSLIGVARQLAAECRGESAA